MKTEHGQSREKVDGRLSRVTEYLRNTLNEPPDYHQLARLANLSYCQLFRLFKQHLGMSPQQYIEQQRIDYAKKLLTLNRLSIKEVAAQTGFTNQLYFSRRFLRATGCSPSQFRSNQRADPEKALHPYSYEAGLYVTPKSYGSYA